MGEVSAVGIEEFGDGVSIHAVSERTDVQLEQQGHRLEERDRVGTELRVVPHHTGTVAQLKVKHVLETKQL